MNKGISPKDFLTTLSTHPIVFFVQSIQMHVDREYSLVIQDGRRYRADIFERRDGSFVVNPPGPEEAAYQSFIFALDHAHARIMERRKEEP